jgi:hypothetical protein
VNTKLSEAEYQAVQAQAATRDLSLGEWMRTRLLAGERDELLLAEMYATRSIIVNAIYGLECLKPWSPEEYKRLVNHADTIKMAAARALLAGEEPPK